MGILQTMAENTKKKTNAKSFIKSVLNIFKKGDTKEKNVETETREINIKVTAPVISPAARFRDKFEKLEREERDNKNEFNSEKLDFDEDRNGKRLESQSSADSGYIEKEEESVANDVTDIFSKLKIDEKESKAQSTEKKKTEQAIEACDNVTDNLKNLNLGEIKKKKEKKVITVTISRTPIVNKNNTSRNQAHPYGKPSSQVTVNRHTFSGGQVIEDDGSEKLRTAFNNLLSSSKIHENGLNKDENLKIITDLIENEQNENPVEEQSLYPDTAIYPQAGQYDNIDLNRIIETTDKLEKIIFGIGGNILPSVPDTQTSPQNFPISPNDDMGQILTSNTTDSFTCPELSFDFDEQPVPSVFFTPPGSVHMASPLQDFQSSPRAHTSSSDYTFSPPDRSSPVISDTEIYQIIDYQPNQLEDQPPVSVESDYGKKMNLKQFKNMQKEISESFSDKECCQKNRKSCTEIFSERFEKFKPVERKNICLNVNRLDLKAALGVLVRILQSIGKGSDKEDLEYSIFRHICGRVLAEQPAWFLGDFGAQLLELAALQCNGHPVLTRYLVECIRTVKAPEGLEPKDCLLPLRVDSRRDTLVLACAAGGDPFADALYWLVAREPHQLPLFDLRHVNTEGYSALHVACKSHGAGSSRLRVAHVLLEHGRADLWQGDHKGGDTALHLAINSPTCDLQLVLLLFHHTEQKQWKRLATWNNLGCVTPIEYARCAVKSKQNFPMKVLEFMKKLR